MDKGKISDLYLDMDNYQVVNKMTGERLDVNPKYWNVVVEIIESFNNSNDPLEEFNDTKGMG